MAVQTITVHASAITTSDSSVLPQPADAVPDRNGVDEGERNQQRREHRLARQP